MNKFEEERKQSLQHGLGVGGGRGRPKGSRNGYINPNAAYMKNYKIVGEVAEEPEEAEGTERQRPATANRMQQYGSGNRQPAQQQTRQAVSRPTSSVQTGKAVLERALGGGTYDASRLTNRANLATQPLQNKADVKIQSPTANSNDNKQTSASLGGGGTTSAAPASGEPSRKEQYDMLQAYRKRKAAEQEAINAPKRAEANNPMTANILGKTTFTKTGNPGQGQYDQMNNTPYDREYQNRNRALATEEQLAKNYENAQARAAARDSVINESVKPTGADATEAAEKYQPTSWWEDLLDWGKNTLDEISKATSSAWNTVSSGAKVASDWLNDRFNDAGSWASTAMKDVTDWIGDRGNELDRWWNGYDVRDNTIANETNHVNGVRENVGNWLNRAGKDVGKAVTDVANNVGRAAGDAWKTATTAADRFLNGYDVRDNTNSNETAHVNGLRQDAANWLDQAGRYISDWTQNNIGKPLAETAKNVGEAAGETAGNVITTIRDAAGNAHQAVVDASGKIVGWIGERAEDVETWWNGEDIIRGNQNGVTSVEHTPGAREAIEEAVGNTIVKARDAAGDIRDAIVDQYGNFVGWVEEQGENLNTWWNGEDIIRGDQNGVTEVEHTPGAREKLGKALSDAGTAVADAATTAGRTAAAAVTSPFGDNFINMTNSQLAQEANRAGMTMPMLNALASTFLAGDPNSVSRQGFDNILAMYADGRLNDQDIQRIIENSSRK